ncbi:MAG: SpoIID/LytB domain-containing protein [Thermoleophilaceae bacterium]|nr:SpoIID/LytB domain-containing protein [Thermoleophilaceae bacterium]
MRRAVLLIAAVLALAVPASADAATRFVVRGAGWGHGIGMSQYGAYGYALEGRGYRSILSHYYTGTRLEQASQRSVRVMLQPDDPYIRVRGATRASGGKRLSPSKTYVARPSGGRIALFTSGGRRVGRFSSGLRLTRPGGILRLLGPALNGVSDGRYRGAIEILAGGGLDAINVLSLDDYVRGVVAGEMPASWPLEALKAQAVTARTYALATRHPEGPFDLYPDTRSQVYRGVAAEGVRSNAAVSGTAGRILTYGGAPAVTYYFSTSGGHTESVQYSFVGSLSKPWLVGVPDPYDFHSPYHRWRASFTRSQLTRALGALGTFRKLKVVKRGTSPRIVRAQVVGSRGTRKISGPDIRGALGLRDTWARFTRVSTAARASHGTPVGRAALAGFPPARATIHGSLDPAPKRALLVVERRLAGRWVKVRRVRMGSRGRYRADVSARGVYRVRAGVIAGPAVRVR